VSGEWAAVAHRGQLTLDVLSAKRASEEGYALPAGGTLLGIIHPDGASPIPCAFRDGKVVVLPCGWWEREAETDRRQESPRAAGSHRR
jgi:hypothetical protein